MSNTKWTTLRWKSSAKILRWIMTFNHPSLRSWNNVTRTSTVIQTLDLLLQQHMLETRLHTLMLDREVLEKWEVQELELENHQDHHEQGVDWVISMVTLFNQIIIWRIRINWILYWLGRKKFRIIWTVWLLILMLTTRRFKMQTRVDHSQLIKSKRYKTQMKN